MTGLIQDVFLSELTREGYDTAVSYAHYERQLTEKRTKQAGTLLEKLVHEELHIHQREIDILKTPFYEMQHIIEIAPALEPFGLHTFFGYGDKLITVRKFAQNFKAQELFSLSKQYASSLENIVAIVETSLTFSERKERIKPLIMRELEEKAGLTDPLDMRFKEQKVEEYLDAEERAFEQNVRQCTGFIAQQLHALENGYQKILLRNETLASYVVKNLHQTAGILKKSTPKQP